MAKINTHMPINIEKRCFFGWLAVPMVNEQVIKILCLILPGEQFDLAAKAPDFRYAVKPDYLTDLTRLTLFKLFGVFDAPQGHKSQGENDRF